MRLLTIPISWTGTHNILRGVSADIERTYAILPLFPRPHPLRSCAVAALATALYCRYVISRCRDDLDALIPLLTEALLLPHDPQAPFFSQITKLFYKLACSLAFRFEQSRSPEDLEYAIKYYRHLLALPPNAIVELNPLEVLDNLTKLLARRLQSTTEVQPDHADEMVGTLQKLAILDPSSEHVGSIAKIMGTILVARLSQYGRAEECDRALKLLTDIEKVCQPERSPEFYVAHGIALTIRFQQTSLYDHCSQAITRFNKSLTGTLLPSEHPLHPLALMGIATVLHHRFTHDKQLRSLEESITHSRTVLSSCPPGHLLRPACLALLSSSLRWRYAFFGNAVFLREADSCVDDALSQDSSRPSGSARRPALTCARLWRQVPPHSRAGGPRRRDRASCHGARCVPAGPLRQTLVALQSRTGVPEAVPIRQPAALARRVDQVLPGRARAVSARTDVPLRATAHPRPISGPAFLFPLLVRAPPEHGL